MSSSSSDGRALICSGIVYAATFLYLMYDVAREEKRERPPVPVP